MTGGYRHVLSIGVELIILYTLGLFVLVPCIVGAVAYYFVVKAVVVARWATMGPHRREIERRRRAIRVRD